MNANDARIVRLFTAQVDGTVEDNTPNANAQVLDQFDLILQAEVGGVLGNSGANYTLTFVAINDDMVTRQVSLNPPATRSRRSGTPPAWIRAATTSSRPARARPTASCATRIAILPA